MCKAASDERARKLKPVYSYNKVTAKKKKQKKKTARIRRQQCRMLINHIKMKYTTVVTSHTVIKTVCNSNASYFIPLLFFICYVIRYVSQNKFERHTHRRTQTTTTTTTAPHLHSLHTAECDHVNYTRNYRSERITDGNRKKKHLNLHKMYIIVR